MTEEEIEALEPGPSLDQMIAGKIFQAKLVRSVFANGEVIHCDFPDRKLGAEYPRLPEFSTDIAAAWKVVKHFEPAWCLSLTRYDYFWEANFEAAKYLYDEHGNRLYDQYGAAVYNGIYEQQEKWSGYFEGESAPHAICLAALGLHEKWKRLK